MKFILPRFLINIERWKWNSEYRIYVSNTGRFKDEYKKELPIIFGKQSGYIAVKTYVGLKSAHRLVMKTWRPTRDMENLTVDHLDHNKRNNALSNLEWVTKEENKRRATVAVATSNQEKATATTAQELNPNMQLTFGTRQYFFHTYDEAADWVINHFISKENRNICNKDRIIKKIKHAVNTKQKYCNYRWKWVEVNE